MTAQVPPKEGPPTPAADPNELSEEDLGKVAGGTLPDPMPFPRPVAPMSVPTLETGVSPLPIPQTFDGTQLTRR